MNAAIKIVMSLILALRQSDAASNLLELYGKEAKFVDSGDGIHRAKLGQSVTLPCKVVDNEYEAIMWEREVPNENTTKLLFAEDGRLTPDDRFRLAADGMGGVWDMIIDSVDYYDSGKYVCMIAGSDKKITHELIVQVPPSVTLVPDSNPLIVRPGEPIDLTCRASGNPPAELQWNKVDETPPSTSVQGGKATKTSAKGGRFYIAKATSADSGTYECTARNDLGEDRRQIRVNVHSPNASVDVAPQVHTPHRMIAGAVGESVNLTCVFVAEPEPQVTWMHNNFPLELSTPGRLAMFQAVRDNHTEVFLSINDVNEADFGTYTCRVANHMGEKKVDVALTASTLLSKTQRHTWSSNYIIDQVEANTLYDIQIRAKNDHGWGSFNVDYLKHRTAKVKRSNSLRMTENTRSISSASSVYKKLQSAPALHCFALLCYCLFASFLCR